MIDENVKLVKELNRTIKEMKNALKDTYKKKCSSTYNYTEKLLYMYPFLDKQILDIEEEIKSTKSKSDYGKRRSKDVIINANTKCFGETETQYDSVVAALERKKRRFRKVIVAVEAIYDDEYFEIIELYYFRNLNEFAVAAELCISQSTVNHNKKRLVGILELMIFGEDALK